MKIIILGGGAVGELVAERLIHEGNEIVIVEADAERCTHLEEVLDAKIIEGNACSIKVLERAGLISADMLIAVTSRDEVNILGCLIAQAYANVRIKVARLRTHEVDRWRAICESKLLDIDLVIHPDSETTERMLEVLTLPGVSQVLQFAGGRVRLFGLPVEENSWFVGKTLSQLDQSGPPRKSLIAMIFRGQKVIIPRGDDTIQAGDHVFVVVSESQLEEAYSFMGVKKLERLQRVFILGGKQLGIEIALRLERIGVNVKLFDRDMERCRKIAAIVEKTVVVHADGTDQRILAEENVDGIDAYVALTGDDEVNIIASLLAKRLGAAKAVALINRIDFQPMVQLLGISSTFSTRLLVVDRILQFVRRGHVLSVTTFREEEAEAIEMVATPGSRYIGKALKDVHFPRGAIVGAIVRPNGDVVVPRGDAVIQLDDRVIFFTLEKVVPKLEKSFFY